MTEKTGFEIFLEQCHAALAEQVSGNTDAFASVWSNRTDALIMGAVGLYSIGGDQVVSHLANTAQHLDWQKLQIENLVTMRNGDLASTMELERMTRHVDGAAEERILRSTQVYRKEEGRWRLVHRHADAVS
jgi:ketosteroid isomerase-like protein